jgi:hypothetical protein
LGWFGGTLGAVILFNAGVGQAAIYPGNGATGFGGTLGLGSLTLTDSGGNLTATFNPNGGFTGNDVVIYIDSISGGFNNNSTFFDNADGGREAVAGNNNGNPSQDLITFPSGFGADYALEFENNVFTGLFGLASGGNGSFNFITGAAPVSGGPYTVTFPLSDIGITPGQSFNFVGFLDSTTAYGSNETIGVSTVTGAPPNAGFSGNVLFSTFDTYTSTPVPEPASIGLVSAATLMLVARRRKA